MLNKNRANEVWVWIVICGPVIPKNIGVFFMTKVEEKPFLPQTCKQLSFCLLFSCSFYQFVILSFTYPGLANCKKFAPFFNQSAYLQSELHKPKQQYFVASFLHAISSAIFSLLTILFCCDFTEMFVRTSTFIMQCLH